MSAGLESLCYNAIKCRPTLIKTSSFQSIDRLRDRGGEATSDVELTYKLDL